jgi:hypothetical protein
MDKEGRDKFGNDKDGRSKLDKESGFYYDINDEGIEYLIAHATIKDVGEDWILTKEWRHRQERGDFFPNAKPGQRWKILYNGNNPWTGIKSAVEI